MPGGGGKKLPKGAEGTEEDESGDSAQTQQAAMMALIHVLMEEQKRAAQEREEVREENVRKEEQRGKERKKEQLETEKRLFNQQVELMRLQRELGEKATNAYREVQAEDKKRDRVLYNMPNYKDGEDLDEYFIMAERKMTAAKLPVEDWKAILEARFSGRLAIEWRDLMAEDGIDFPTARDRSLKSCGYTQRYAADSFFWFKADDCKGLTANQLYSRGQQLLRRIAAPVKIGAELKFSLLKGWVGTVIPKKARIALDARVVEDPGALITAVQDFLAVSGDKGEGQTAVFRGNSFNEGREKERERNSGRNCFKCGKYGHKAADCWGARYDNGGAKPGLQSNASGTGSAPKSGGNVKIVCFTCQEEGHKSTQCPKRVEKGKDSKTKPVKKVAHDSVRIHMMEGEVNGISTSILLDSGASISVVPETLVKTENLIGTTVVVKAYGGELTELPMADVIFKLAELEWTEQVAVGKSNEVIYGLDLESDRGIQIILSLNKRKWESVNQVVTRSAAKVEEQEVALSDAQEGPKVMIDMIGQEQDVVAQEIECPVAISEPVEVVEVSDCLGSLAEVDDDDSFGLELDTSDEQEERYCVKQDMGGDP